MRNEFKITDKCKNSCFGAIIKTQMNIKYNKTLSSKIKRYKHWQTFRIMKYCH